ncbi:hypothetical protein OROMI_011875 [Orobanche minor]
MPLVNKTLPMIVVYSKTQPPMSKSHSFCLPSSKIPSLLQKTTNVGLGRRVTFQRISTKQPLYSSSAYSCQQSIEELPPRLREIVNLFQAVQDGCTKQKELLFYGRNLKPLDARYKTRENKVQGCVSQIWVRAYFDNDKNVIFEADSDAEIHKGLVALLVQGLSGLPVEEIVKVSPDFAVLLGLPQILSFSRNNGFFNTLELMKKKALQLYVGSEKPGNEVCKEASSDSPGGSSISGLEERVKSEGRGGDGDIDGSVVDFKLDCGNYGRVLGNRWLRIKEKLDSELNPIVLEVEDISYQHGGGIETHFNVKVVSKEFEGKSVVKRHRVIYCLLQDELQNNGLQALSIVAKTPSEITSSS